MSRQWLDSKPLVACQELKTFLKRKKKDPSVLGIKEETSKIITVATRTRLPAEAVRLWQMGTKANLPIHLFRSKDVLWILLLDFFMPRKIKSFVDILTMLLL